MLTLEFHFVHSFNGFGFTVPAAILGLFYLVGREIYFRGYTAAAEKR